MSEFKISVRKMTEGDVKWVVSVGENTPEFKTSTNAAQFFGNDTLRRWVNDPNGITLLAKVNGKPAGFLLGYYMTGPNDGYINCTVVASEFRRQGIGKELQEAAIEEFKQKGPEGHKCDHIFYVVGEEDEAMLDLSRQTGFEIGRRFHYVEKMLH